MEAKRIIGIVLGLLTFIVLYFLPTPGLNAAAHNLSAVIGLVVVFWITEAIPLAATALLGSVLAAIFGVDTPDRIFAPYANKIIFLFLGAFMVGRAMTRHGLDERIALSVTKINWIRVSKTRTVIALALVGMFLSMWISNTAATIIIIPIAMAALKGTEDKSIKSLAALSAAFAANIGGIGTPVGTPPNLIALGFLDEQHINTPNFFEWMIIGVPIMLVMIVAMLLTRRIIMKKDVPGESKGFELPAWKVGEVSTLLIFLFMVVLWITPGILKITFGAKAPVVHWFKTHLHESVVAILGASLLFFAPGELKPYKPVLTWREAEEIDWGTILLFGGGLSLGGLIRTTGLATVLGNYLITSTGASTMTAVVLLSVITGKIFTELVSNTATANMLVPVTFVLANQLHLNPVPPVIGVALGAGLAFLLPISTPPNAVAFGTGDVTVGQMIKWGIIMDIVAVIAISAWLLFLVHAGFFR